VTLQVPKCEPKDTKNVPHVTETGPKDTEIVLNAC
jgi:hypothetical protein